MVVFQDLEILIKKTLKAGLCQSM